MSLSQPTLHGFCPRGIKQGSHRLGDYLATLANSKFVKFEKYSPKFSRLPNFLCAHRTFSQVLEIFKIRSSSIRRPWHLIRNPLSSCCFPQIFTKLWQTICWVCQITVNRSPHSQFFTKQFSNSLQFADLSPRSPISRQMIAERSENNHLLVFKRIRQLFADFVHLWPSFTSFSLIENMVWL